VLDCHRRRLSERERRRREHQKRRGTALFGHARDARCFEAAVGPDAVDDRQPAADLVPRDVEHPALLIEGAGGDFRRMGIDGDRGEVRGLRDIAKMFAEAALVDRKVFRKR
jgi:hypothetical protein